MEVQEVPDVELLHAWRAGDARAGSTLVRRHSPRLHRFFANKLRSGAEDLCQQTWAACVAARDRIEDDGASRSFRAYLFAAARSRLLNHYRSAQRDAERFDPLTTSVASLTGGQSAVIAQSEEQRRLQQALQELPMDAQIALELHYWEQLSTREIAEVLGAPEGTIKARLSRARRQLQQQLAGVD